MAGRRLESRCLKLGESGHECQGVHTHRLLSRPRSRLGGQGETGYDKTLYKHFRSQCLVCRDLKARTTVHASSCECAQSTPVAQSTPRGTGVLTGRSPPAPRGKTAESDPNRRARAHEPAAGAENSWLGAGPESISLENATQHGVKRHSVHGLTACPATPGISRTPMHREPSPDRDSTLKIPTVDITVRCMEWVVMLRAMSFGE